MHTQTVWDNKAPGLVTAPSRRAVVQYAAFYLVFALFAAPLYWLLPAAFEAADLAWRGEYALWVAVPVCVLTVLARYVARKYLRD